MHHLFLLLSREERKIISLHIIPSSQNDPFAPEHAVVISLSSFHAPLPVSLRHGISLHPILFYPLSFPQQLLATTASQPTSQHPLHRKLHHRFRNLRTGYFVRPLRQVDRFLKSKVPAGHHAPEGLSCDPRAQQQKCCQIIDTLCAEAFQGQILPVRNRGIFTSGERQRRNTSLGRNPSNKSVGVSVKKRSICVASSVSMSFVANAALDGRRFKRLRSRRNG